MIVRGIETVRGVRQKVRNALAVRLTTNTVMPGTTIATNYACAAFTGRWRVARNNNPDPRNVPPPITNNQPRSERLLRFSFFFLFS